MENEFNVAIRVRGLLPSEDSLAWLVKNNHLSSMISQNDHLPCADSRERKRVL